MRSCSQIGGCDAFPDANRQFRRCCCLGWPPAFSVEGATTPANAQYPYYYNPYYAYRYYVPYYYPYAALLCRAGRRRSRWGRGTVVGAMAGDGGWGIGGTAGAAAGAGWGGGRGHAGMNATAAGQ